MLDINVTRALGGDLGVDHIDGRLVVAIHDGGAFGWKSKVGHDRAHVSSMLRCGNSGKEFRFSGAGSGDGLRLASVGDSATTQEEGIACSGSAVAQIIGVGGIEKRNWFLRVDVGKLRERGIHGGADEVGRRKGCVWLGPTVNNAPVFGSSEVFCHFLDHSKMMVMRARGELR